MDLPGQITDLAFDTHSKEHSKIMALLKFKITRGQDEPEEIEAADVVLRDGWFYFGDGDGLVAQIRSDGVERLDRI
jgi:hypothetical protein